MDDRAWRVDLSDLPGKLERVRQRLREAEDSPFSAEADAAFDSDPAEVAAWLRLAEQLARSGKFLTPLRPADPPLHTLYLEMNAFDFNPELWLFDAFGCGPPPAQGPPIIGTAFDAVAGHFIGDVSVDAFTLTGMEGLQNVFAEVRARNEEAPGEEHAVDLVRLSWFQLLDTAMAHPEPPRIRVAAAVHDEVDRFAVWETSPGAST